ncbi:MAG: hypothetical protein A3C83_00120 [Candidatus Ryanbacteria bacterium RIFCSPHIGHO2_02_FULL_47_25]|nr:MAG: hypothetical protein A3C83_00120 [Candidatus Ryanbacteria bacterium RIFCSPHIGHO2_02_FULL_47_25]
MDIKKKITNAPQTPGVYYFKDRHKRVIYVGKAANLRARLRSYAQPGWKEDMLREASSITWEELSSDIEALIRESELIKKLKPHYNILMRDDKNYFFVAFTGDEFPRIYLTHQPNKDVGRPNGRPTSKYIGPFTDGNALKQVLRLLRRTFPYCTCSARTRHKRQCVNAELGKCLGFCCVDVAARACDLPDHTVVRAGRARYRANITAIKKVLTGKSRALEHSLARAMERAARARRYEQAKIVRDQIASLKRIFEHHKYLQQDIQAEREKGLVVLQNLLRLARPPQRIECYDISHHQGDTSVASMAVFENGIPAKNEYRKFIIRKVKGINDPAMLTEVLARRLTHQEWQAPDLILVDGGKAQLNAALRVLKTSRVQRGVSLAAIAKREEELYLVGKKDPLKLRELPPPVLHLITALRNEAHRFAVSFHRARRKKTLLL